MNDRSAAGPAAKPGSRWARPSLYHAGFIAIFLIAVALRGYHLGTQSLWVDELGEGTSAEDDMSRFVTDLRADFGAAPLDYLGVKLFTTVLGHSTIATRSWAFAMGSLGVVLIYVLGSRLFNDRVAGLIAAGMMTFSAFDIYYSQEARFYALAIVAGMLNLYAFLRALDSGAARDWIIYAVCTAIALYSHFFLAALLPVEGVYLAGAQVAIARRDSSRGGVKAAVTQVGLCLAAQVAAFLVFVPWLVSELSVQGTAGYPELPALGIRRVYQIFVVLIGMAPLNSVGPNGLGALMRTNIVLGLAALGFVWELALRRWRVLLLAGIIGIAIPLAWRSDQVEHYFWAERQVIFVLVPLYLLAATGMGHVITNVVRWFLQMDRFRSLSRAAVAVALFAIVAATWAAAYSSPIVLVYSDRWEPKEDWRSVATFIDQNECTDSQYWTYVNAHYSYGFAYYDPALGPRSHYLWELPGGGSTTDPVAAVQAQHLGANDWIILATGMTTSTANGMSADETLRALGWSPTAFNGLTVYHQMTCTR